MRDFYEFFNPHTEALLQWTNGHNRFQGRESDFFRFYWNQGDSPVELCLDGRLTVVPPEHILCCTYLHYLRVQSGAEQLQILRFNQPFYCIDTYDQEVSCSGLLFFGSTDSPLLGIPEANIPAWYQWQEVLEQEFETEDRNQEEMLRVLLKRFIILCTRLGRSQIGGQQHGDSQELLRHFNVLVEQHFREKHRVVDYAEMLHRSPKSLGNALSRLNSPPPLEIIHQRITLEARRQLLYSNASAQEIAYDLGFEDPMIFSRFFKQRNGQSPMHWRRENRTEAPTGKIVNN